MPCCVERMVWWVGRSVRRSVGRNSKPPPSQRVLARMAPEWLLIDLFGAPWGVASQARDIAGEDVVLMKDSRREWNSTGGSLGTSDRVKDRNMNRDCIRGSVPDIDRQSERHRATPCSETTNPTAGEQSDMSHHQQGRFPPIFQSPCRPIFQLYSIHIPFHIPIHIPIVFVLCLPYSN